MREAAASNMVVEVVAAEAEPQDDEEEERGEWAVEMSVNELPSIFLSQIGRAHV